MFIHLGKVIRNKQTNQYTFSTSHLYEKKRQNDFTPIKKPNADKKL